MSEATRNFRIGLTTIVGLGSLTTLLLAFGELDSLFRSTYVITVRSDRGAGLRSGSQVLLNGVNIGTVSSIGLDTMSEEPVVVILHINSASAIPSSAIPFSDMSLFGTGAKLDFRIPPDAVAVDEFFPKDGTAVVRTGFQSFEDRLVAMVDDKFGHLDETLKAFDTLARDLDDLVRPMEEGSAESEFNIRTSVHKLNKALASADSAFRRADEWLGDEQLRVDFRSAVWKAGIMIDEATAAMQVITSAAKGIEGDADALRQGFEPVMERMRSTMDHVDSLAKDARDGKGTMGQLLTNPDLYNSLNDSANRLRTTLSEMELLLRKIREEGLDVKF
ncbi:MAG: MlaD family protein [Planctomycetota bacterium]|nr:MlaD family protein [Planctomycetota bacterium]